MQIFSLMVENLGRDRDKLNGKERETHKNIDIEIERHSKIVRKKKTQRERWIEGKESEKCLEIERHRKEK